MSSASGTPGDAVIEGAGERSFRRRPVSCVKNQCNAHFAPNRRTGSDLPFSLIPVMLHVYLLRRSNRSKYAVQVCPPVRPILEKDQWGGCGAYALHKYSPAIILKTQGLSLKHKRGECVHRHRCETTQSKSRPSCQINDQYT